MTKPHPSYPNLPHTLTAIALIVAASVSAMLSFQRISAITLPGCSPTNSCAQAFQTVWSTIPLIHWPIAHLATAALPALVILWLISPSKLARRLLDLALLTSLSLTIIMLIENLLCPYCLAVHTSILTAWITSRLTPRPNTTLSPPTLITPTLTVFIITTSLILTQAAASTQATTRAQDQLAQNTQDLASSTATSSAPSFTGRYTLGPTNAPIHIVIFSDYQCPDCKAVESQIDTLLKTRTDVSVSFKHFPMCSDCNKNLTSNPHPNACWAARAVEAAGFIGSIDTYTTMHQWLFSVQGSFTDNQLNQQLKRMNLDQKTFITLMTSSTTLDLVQQDIDQALSLGLTQTPMIFINNIELTGFSAHNAIIRAVQSIPATQRQKSVTPPSAQDRLVNLWKNQTPKPQPPDTSKWTLGPTDAPIRITMFGDHLQPKTAEAHNTIMALLSARSDINYTYRHHPVDRTCNPAVKKTIHPGACLAAKATEAAGQLAGNDAFWAMNDWLLSNPDAINRIAILEIAPQMGLDIQTFQSLLDEPVVGRAIVEDARAAARLGVHAVPTVYINDKPISRISYNDLDVITLIVQAASQK